MEDGDTYAQKLARFVETKICRNKATGKVVPTRLWTSTLEQAVQTGKYIKCEKITLTGDDYGAWITGEDGNTHTDGNASEKSQSREWSQCRPKRLPALNEIYAGMWDGLRFQEVKQRYPEECARRQKEKLVYRCPRGESYLDVIQRMDSMIREMETYREPLLIISHQAVLRVICAFYMGLPRERVPFVRIPNNCVIKLTPMTYGCEEQRFFLHTNEHNPVDKLSQLTHL